jgi:hypothetical protein
MRGIFHHESDPPYWRDAVASFPNKIPRFESTGQAQSWVKTVCEIGSNPDEPHLHHNITTLTDWKQIEKHLLPKIEEYRNRWREEPAIDEVKHNDGPTDEKRRLDDNIYLSSATENIDGPKSVYKSMLSRLDLPVHRHMSSGSVMNTLLYLFHHMKCGIYVMIRNNEPVIFCPFVNKDYKNTWSDKLELDCPDNTPEQYFEIKSQFTRRENFIDKSEWWANGNIICNEHTKLNESKESSQWWGDHFLFQLKDMIAETCNNRYVPNCEFFINKRDYPQLKYSMDRNRVVEPYGFIFNRDDRDENQDVELSRHRYKSYAPIL